MAQLVSLSSKRLRRFLGWGIGSFGVLFSTVPAGAEIPVSCEAEPTDMIVTFGALVTCSVDVLGDTDIFRFQGVSGEVVVAQAAMPGLTDSSLEFFDPNGMLVGSATSSTTAQVRITLSESGDYAIVVKERDDNATGSYTFALERIAPPSPGAPRLVFGLETAALIDAHGDLDLYHFEAASGEAVTTQAAMPSFADSRIEVFDPDGFLLDSSDGSTSARLDLMLAKTGVYSLLVKERDDNETGPYTLALERVSECRGTDDHDLSAQMISTTVVVEACNTISAGDGFVVGSVGDVTFLAGTSVNLRDGFLVEVGGTFNARVPAWGTSISYGDDLRLALTLVGEMEVFYFTGEAGEAILTQAVMPGVADSRIEVYDPDGFRLAMGEGSTTGRVGVILTTSGTHSILVKERDDNETEVFTVVLERLAPPSPAARDLCFGCNLIDTVDPVGDVDTFTFAATGTETISVQVSMPGVGDARLELYDPDGLRIAASDGSTTASIQVALTKPGAHTLLVKERDDNETEDYNVTLQCVAGCAS